MPTTLATAKWNAVEEFGYEVSDILVPQTPRTFLTSCVRDRSRFWVNRPKLIEQFGKYVPKRNGGRLARLHLESTSLMEAQKATPLSSLMRRATGLQKATHDTFNLSLVERGIAMSLLQAEWVFDQEQPPSREEISRATHFVVCNEENDILVANFRLYNQEDGHRQTSVSAGDIHSRTSLNYFSGEVMYFLAP